MPVATLIEFPGVTQEQYDRVGARLGRSEPPAGILHHACGAVPGGWRVMDIWESAEAFDRFIDGTYLPAMRTAGGPEPSRREVVPVYHAGAVRRE